MGTNAVDIFEFKARKMTEEQSQKMAHAIMLDVMVAIKRYGQHYEGCSVLSDPDMTFMATKTDSYVQVVLMEGEAKGDHVLLVDLPNSKVLHYEPGPWEYRVRKVLG